MSSNQPDCLTSLVSYVPELNFGFNSPSTAVVNQFGISATNQVSLFNFLRHCHRCIFIPDQNVLKKQTVPLPPESLTSLEIVSARVNSKGIAQARTSPRPLRPALKKTSLVKPWNKVEEKLKNIEKSCEENRITAPKHSTETEARAQKSQPLPARLLQRKKTVAFGRTVNVSQTIEFEELKKEVREMKLKIDELMMKDSERNDQFLKLTETMKKMLEGVAQFNVLSNTNNEESKKYEKKVGTEMRCRGKENIPPKVWCSSDSFAKSFQHNIDNKRKKIINGSSTEDLKWKILKRKYAENEEFKRLVDEAIMKCGGDESLDIFACHQNTADTDRAPLRHEKKAQPISPVIRSTTRVTKQMTVEQIQHCENSPASCAFSYDSKKYLERHGIIPALNDDAEVEYYMECGKRSDPSMQSYYYPGNSVTYYSENTKYNNKPLKNNCHSDYQGERYHHKEKGAPRVFDEPNYQMDHFDTDDDEDVNNIIEITDGLEVEDHYGTAGKAHPTYNKRDWRDLEHNDFQHEKNDGRRHYTKQRLNKSAWD
uniref:Reverse transcriptase domain-containing protein n=1 Tax=Elaeophora elaphi TaxID=1147741 RepID=A0A0R3S6Q0_9BILA